MMRTLIIFIVLITCAHAHAEKAVCIREEIQPNENFRFQPNPPREGGTIQLTLVAPAELSGNKFQHAFLVHKDFSTHIKELLANDVLAFVVVGKPEFLSAMHISITYGIEGCTKHVNVPLKV